MKSRKRSKKEEIKIVVVTNNRIYDTIIKNKNIYDFVNFPIEELLLADDIYVIYSKEKIFTKNMTIKGRDIYSTFIIVKKKKNKYISLTNEDIKNVMNLLLK